MLSDAGRLIDVHLGHNKKHFMPSGHWHVIHYMTSEEVHRPFTIILESCTNIAISAYTHIGGSERPLPHYVVDQEVTFETQEQGLDFILFRRYCLFGLEEVDLYSNGHHTPNCSTEN